MGVTRKLSRIRSRPFRSQSYRMCSAISIGASIRIESKRFGNIYTTGSSSWELRRSRRRVRRWRASFRRLWGNVLDVFVSLFPLVIYVGFRMIPSSSGGGGRRQRGRGGFRRRGGDQEPEQSWLDQASEYATSPEAVWETVEVYGPWVLGLMAYRAPVRSAATGSVRRLARDA